MDITGEIKVESGIPLPAYARNNKYPWASLKVGDSFFVPHKGYKYVKSASYYRQKAYGEKFAVRTVFEKGVVGVRVWRVA